MTTANLVRTTDDKSHDDPAPEAEHGVRISFRQPVATTGFIDAAWWPRTRDLTAELPPLLDVLWTAGREVQHITYNLTAWDPAPRHLRIEGRTVRLGGFATSDPITIRLSDAWGRERVDVLVVTPDTDAAVAERALQIAGEADGAHRAAEILALAAEAGTPESADHS